MKVDISRTNIDGLEGYMRCDKCGSKRMYYGGQGDWRQTILCEDCFHIRRGVPLEVIWDLMVATYPNITDREDAKRRDEKAQKLWHKTLADAAIDPRKKVRT